MNGPPLVIYGALRRWSPQHFRATLQGYFLPASLAGLGGYSGRRPLDARGGRVFTSGVLSRSSSSQRCLAELSIAAFLHPSRFLLYIHATHS